jgi:hypothetical protein
MSHQPNNVFAGTQVVSLVDVRGTKNSLVHPRGAELLAARQRFVFRLINQTYDGYVRSRFKNLEQPLQSGLLRPTSPSKELPGFIHERMLERTGVSVENPRFEPESSPRISPAGKRCEHFTQNILRLARLKAKARRDGQRTFNARFFLIFGNGRFVGADTVHFRYRVDVVGR